MALGRRPQRRPGVLEGLPGLLRLTDRPQERRAPGLVVEERPPEIGPALEAAQCRVPVVGEQAILDPRRLRRGVRRLEGPPGVDSALGMVDLQAAGGRVQPAGQPGDRAVAAGPRFWA